MQKELDLERFLSVNKTLHLKLFYVTGERTSSGGMYTCRRFLEEFQSVKWLVLLR